MDEEYEAVSEAIEQLREHESKFDHFLLGATVGVLAFTAGSSGATRWNALLVVTWALLFFSLICGFVRQHLLQRCYEIEYEDAMNHLRGKGIDTKQVQKAEGLSRIADFSYYFHLYGLVLGVGVYVFYRGIILFKDP